MKHNSHHGHFEAPREKRRLTGKQKGIIGIVLALAVLAGVATGIYKTLVKPPEKPQPVQEETQDANTQPEPEVKKPTIKHVVTKVDEQTGEEVEEETELPASHQTGVYNILICGTDDDGYRTDTIIVAHLNETTHDVALMSVPRDTVVLNGSGGIMKINSVYAGGGADGISTALLFPAGKGAASDHSGRRVGGSGAVGAVAQRKARQAGEYKSAAEGHEGKAC